MLTHGLDAHRHPRRPPLLWIIVGISVLLRVVAAVYLGNTVTLLPGIADQDSYHHLALRVLDGHGFTFAANWWPATPAGEPTAHWSFLYVLYLAGVYGLVGPYPLVARLLQATLVGVVQPLLAFSISRRLFGDRVGIVSAILTAGYLYFVYYAAALMTEAFYVAALLWAIDRALILGAQRPGPRIGIDWLGWLALGAACATAALLRQVVLLVVPVVLLWVSWRQVRQGSPAVPHLRRIGAVVLGATAAVLVMAVAIAPWTVRNYRVFHQVVLLNTNAGFAFYWGNHPIHGAVFKPLLPGDGSHYGKLIPPELLSLNEGQLDRALLRRGLGFVAEDPVRFITLSLTRIPEFVKFWPSSDSGRASNLARLLSFGLCFPFMVLGVAIASRRPAKRMLQLDQQEHGEIGVDRDGAWLLLAVAFIYSLVHVLTWTLVRYRLPVDGLMMPFAGVTLVWLVARMRTHQSAVGVQVPIESWERPR